MNQDKHITFMLEFNISSKSSGSIIGTFITRSIKNRPITLSAGILLPWNKIELVQTSKFHLNTSWTVLKRVIILCV